MSQRCIIGSGGGGTPVVVGCQAGPIAIGTSNASSISLATNGCTPRLVVGSAGNVTVNAPTSGIGLTVNSGVDVVTGDVNIQSGNLVLVAPTPNTSTASAVGLIELGGANASSSNVSLFNLPSRNVFIGNYTTVPNSTGADNISIGTDANSNLTTENLSIAIGCSDGAGAPQATTTAIAIGSGNGAFAGPNSSNFVNIAIGSSDGNTAGAIASGGAYSIALGCGSLSEDVGTISIGSGDNVGANSQSTGGISIGSGLSMVNGAVATSNCGVAIGSSNATSGGAASYGYGSIALGCGTSASSTGTVAIGGTDGTLNGAIADNNYSISIGTNSHSAASDSGIAIGQGASTSAHRTVSIGAADASSSGLGPRAQADNTIAIGSGSGTVNGPTASGTGGISIGLDSSATVGNSIAIGSGTLTQVGATASGNPGLGGRCSIAIGGADTLAAGLGAQATAALCIAVGTASVASANYGSAIGYGAQANAQYSMAFGPFDGTTTTQANGIRSLALGAGTQTSQDDAVILGNASTTNVKVGIGTAAPSSKLYVVGVNGTPVLTLDQVNTGIGNSPVWLNPSTSAGVGTPIHYDGSNRLYGFSSSARYKENIRAMNDYSEKIYELSPSLYDAKDGSGKNIAGFIAEEVEKVGKELTIYNREGQPENVAYNSILTMLVNEVQKLRKQVDSLLEERNAQ